MPPTYHGKLTVKRLKVFRGGGVGLAQPRMMFAEAAVMDDSSGESAGGGAPVRVRTKFPETWLYENVVAR